MLSNRAQSITALLLTTAAVISFFSFRKYAKRPRLSPVKWSLLLGSQLINAQGTLLDTDKHLAGKKYIILYIVDLMSASDPLLHPDSLCSKLIKFYSRSVRREIEIVFVSSNRGSDVRDFQLNVACMPWVSMTHASKELRLSLSKRFQRRGEHGIPKVLLVNGDTGIFSAHNPRHEMLDSSLSVAQTLAAWATKF